MATTDWEISCSLEILQKRAQLLTDIRAYFSDEGVLEVETPLLSHGIGTDIFLAFFSTHFSNPPEEQTLFLQTSPEFAMKRMLASGSGSIFQICKAFRNGETGNLHNPEFTILEWYRVDFDLDQLMADVDELVRRVTRPYLTLLDTQRITYQDVFFQYTGLDALQFDQQKYISCARASELPDAEKLCCSDHSMWLDFLFSHLVQPNLGKGALVMVYDYPACLPSLARLCVVDIRVSKRVEIFLSGIELGNGYYELTDYKEQLTRFEVEIEERKIRGLPAVKLNKRFLEALRQGLPDCSGMAIGLDRLLMLMTGNENLGKILAFSIRQA